MNVAVQQLALPLCMSEISTQLNFEGQLSVLVVDVSPTYKVEPSI